MAVDVLVIARTNHQPQAAASVVDHVLHQASPPVEPWVKAVLLVIALAALVVGIVIWRGSKDHAKDVITTRDELMKDMWELHRTYFPSDDLDKNE
jgi:hypothetical protein